MAYMLAVMLRIAQYNARFELTRDSKRGFPLNHACVLRVAVAVALCCIMLDYLLTSVLKTQASHYIG